MFDNSPLYIAGAFTIGWIIIHCSERYANAVTAVLGFFLLMGVLYGSSLWAEHSFAAQPGAAVIVQSEDLGKN